MEHGEVERAEREKPPFLVELGKDGMEMEVYLLFVRIHVESGVS